MQGMYFSTYQKMHSYLINSWWLWFDLTLIFLMRNGHLNLPFPSFKTSINIEIEKIKQLFFFFLVFKPEMDGFKFQTHFKKALLRLKGAVRIRRIIICRINNLLKHFVRQIFFYPKNWSIVLTIRQKFNLSKSLVCLINYT